ncbi:hypothetical protein C2G38_2212899 [Gigaspora rosea]|uniref:Uncharacterized protein n=1 Tax=Gigaspora rosea TaxID=44941 RepID=A0A397UFJ8_9GLOM|nr:hypothetical protein C2G38_2212899 [Gigaspora rosea]
MTKEILQNERKRGMPERKNARYLSFEERQEGKIPKEILQEKKERKSSKKATQEPTKRKNAKYRTPDTYTQKEHQKGEN